MPLRAGKLLCLETVRLHRAEIREGMGLLEIAKIAEIAVASGKQGGLHHCFSPIGKGQSANGLLDSMKLASCSSEFKGFDLWLLGQTQLRHEGPD